MNWGAAEQRGRPLDGGGEEAKVKQDGGFWGEKARG